MALMTRRGFLRAAAGGSAGVIATGGYAFGIEPGFLLELTSYRLTPRHWPAGLRLKIAVIADIHACKPWMSAHRVHSICAHVNALKPDMVVLLGDYVGGHRIVSGPVMPEAWGAALSVLRAPLGVYGVMGNHDLMHGALPNMPAEDGEPVRRALRNAGVRVLENDTLRLDKDGQAFWLVGLADQLIHSAVARGGSGFDDLPGCLAQVSDHAPVILLAHEPYIFPKVPAQVSLTLSGHTHGGQIRLPDFSRAWMSDRVKWSQTYGHFDDNGKHMIVSAGLGTSMMPVRLLRPPEIVSVELGGPMPIA
jgi:predicted MPP superfamily phosphohydrolase